MRVYRSASHRLHPQPSTAPSTVPLWKLVISLHATHDLWSMLHSVAWLTAAAARPARPWRRLAASQLARHRENSTCACTGQLLIASIRSRQRRRQRCLSGSWSSLCTQHMISGRCYMLWLGSQRRQLVRHARGTVLLRPSSLAIVRTRRVRVRVSFTPPPSTARQRRLSRSWPSLCTQHMISGRYYTMWLGSQL